VKLADYFKGKPVILTPVYYRCPMLCGELLNGFVRALRVLRFTAGNEFEIVTFSIDPAEKPDLASAKKKQYIHDYGRQGAAEGWHFLTGTAESIDNLAGQIGFRYSYDRATKQWAHASTIIVLTPDGRLAQYFPGIEFDPGDLRLSLVQASNGSIGSVIDHVLLYCYRYDASTGKYSLAIMRVIQLCSIGTMLVLALFIIKSRVAAVSP
jgi:protein SCO1/2